MWTRLGVVDEPWRLAYEEDRRDTEGEGASDEDEFRTEPQNILRIEKKKKKNFQEQKRRYWMAFI